MDPNDELGEPLPIAGTPIEDAPTIEPVARKRRGRPPKQKVEVQEIDGPLSAAKPKRGRKPKVISRDAGQVAGMARNIQGIHAMLALATGLPELAISETEAKVLADALDTVQREFGLSVSGKFGAIIGLIGAGGIIYIPRGIQIAHRRPRKKDPDNVVPINPAPTMDSASAKDIADLEAISMSHAISENKPE